MSSAEYRGRPGERTNSNFVVCNHFIARSFSLLHSCSAVPTTTPTPPMHTLAPYHSSTLPQPYNPLQTPFYHFQLLFTLTSVVSSSPRQQTIKQTALSSFSHSPIKSHLPHTD